MSGLNLLFYTALFFLLSFASGRASLLPLLLLLAFASSFRATAALLLSPFPPPSLPGHLRLQHTSAQRTDRW